IFLWLRPHPIENAFDVLNDLSLVNGSEGKPFLKTKSCGNTNEVAPPIFELHRRDRPRLLVVRLDSAQQCVCPLLKLFKSYFHSSDHRLAKIILVVSPRLNEFFGIDNTLPKIVCSHKQFSSGIPPSPSMDL